MDDGMISFVNPVVAKDQDPIQVNFNPFSKINEINKFTLEQQSFPRKVTDGGRIRLSNQELKKVRSSIRSNIDPLSNESHPSDQQHSKHDSQRTLTDSEMMILVKQLL